MSKSLVSIEDLSLEEIQKIFALAKDVKKNPRAFKTALEDKKIALIFEKPSTRTRVSFYAGILELGGSSVYLGPQDIQLGAREETKDVARVLDRYLSGAILRTFSHKTIEEFAKYFTKPVINGLSDYSHPCQALADYFTIYERKHSFEDVKLAYVGDGNNVLSSLLLLAAKLGTKLSYATPQNHEPSKEVLELALRYASESGAQITGSNRPEEVVKDADFIYTDVWVSMGEEEKRETKLRAFDGMQVNQDLVAKAKPSVSVMHCLPAHRDEEIADEVMEGKHSIVFDQAENRLHVQKAILIHLFT